MKSNAFAPASSSANRLFISNGAGTDPNAPDLSLVESFVGSTSLNADGHPSLDAGGPVEGSAVKRTFSAHVGDSLSIQYDYLTDRFAFLSQLSPDDIAAIGNRPIYPDDFSFITLTYGSTTQVYRIADVLTLGYLAADVLTGDRFVYHTGFLTLNITLPADATYTLAFGVLDGGADYLTTINGGLTPSFAHAGESALLINSIDLDTATPVPTPAAAPAGLALLLAVAARRLRRA